MGGKYIDRERCRVRVSQARHDVEAVILVGGYVHDHGRTVMGGMQWCVWASKDRALCFVCHTICRLRRRGTFPPR